MMRRPQVRGQAPAPRALRNAGHENLQLAAEERTELPCRDPNPSRGVERAGCGEILLGKHPEGSLQNAFAGVISFTYLFRRAPLCLASAQRSLTRYPAVPYDGHDGTVRYQYTLWSESRDKSSDTSGSGR